MQQQPNASSTSSHQSQTLSTGPPSTQTSNSTPPPFLGKHGTTGDPTLAKRRARNLLRDYYGLASSSEASSPSRSDTGISASNPIAINSSQTTHHHQTHASSDSIDSPYFDVDTYFHNLIKNSSLKSLLSHANTLLNEISQLDAERQSLVYNHHHELVEASETIDKMKSSSEKLDGTLAQLQDSFSCISELSTTLSSRSSNRQGNDGKPSVKVTTNLSKAEEEESEESVEESRKKLIEKYENGLHLLALLSLPTILKGLLMTGEKNNRANADQLWGQWEPALRSFEEAGIHSVKQIGNECRDILRNSNSSNC